LPATADPALSAATTMAATMINPDFTFDSPLATASQRFGTLSVTPSWQSGCQGTGRRHWLQISGVRWPELWREFLACQENIFERVPISLIELWKSSRMSTV
jgi:hypothetical protein